MFVLDSQRVTAWLARSVAAFAVVGLLMGGAHAAYPDRTITLIVPFPAGGTVDTVARIAGARIGEILGTNVVVEPAPGAGGTIATQRVARAAPDGYTLLFTTPNHTINPAIRPALPFVAHSDLPFKDFAGFVEYARQNPGKLNYASAGNGTLPHVTMELLLQALKLDVAHIPYKGAAPALQDVLSKQVDLKMDTIVTATPHINSGLLVPLALADLKRSPLMPDVPTIDESGAPGYVGILWMGILAPRGTDEKIIQTLAKAIAEAVKTPAVLERFEAAGVEAVSNSPEEFGAMIAAEIAQWKEVVKAANITVD